MTMHAVPEQTFAGLAERTRATLSRLGASAIEIPDTYARRELIRESGNVVATYEKHELAGADIRVIRLFSAKIDVFTCFAFPNPASWAPVYAMEFVQIGGRPIVAVIDCLSLCGDARMDRALDRALDEARAHYPVPNDADAPDWYEACRSGRDIYTRPKSSDAFNPLSDIHERLFSFACEWHVDAKKLADEKIALHRDRIGHYKHHHCVNSPGLPIMEKTFGVEWTKHFMHDWVFR